MTVQRWELGQGPRRQAVAGGPIAEVVVGADQEVGVGVVDVTVPAGAVMPEHAHGNSATLLLPQEGKLRLVESKGGAVTELEPGSVATIPAGLHVRLENPGESEARMLVVLTPPDFAASVANWPEAT